ncbi:hypothetical protein AYI70_g11148 [Smittium culicis]|uniref:Uncharacterized protein n=1 Tax=Smittium culicis TaxID=133412 RepID=A0A1R1X370_9FUNG|nr:hypothetical protein AYI70_g11148 [Smittium culicis]
MFSKIFESTFPDTKHLSSFSNNAWLFASLPASTSPSAPSGLIDVGRCRYQYILRKYLEKVLFDIYSILDQHNYSAFAN